MNAKTHRLTLVVSGSANTGHEWKSAAETTRLLFLDSIDALDEMMSNVTDLDVERVVLECGSARAARFLELLADHGVDCAADFLLISGGGGGFLSTLGRGGDRILYSLTRTDVAFYLATHSLTAGESPISDRDRALATSPSPSFYVA